MLLSGYNNSITMCMTFLKDDKENLKRKKKRIPPAKPFDPEAIRSIGGEVASDGDFLIFEGNRYSRKGFLYKSFAMSAIIADGKLLSDQSFAEGKGC